MKSKIKCLLLICLVAASGIKAQQNCPAGYEERTVKCNGKFVKKCLPSNSTCNLCWMVEYPPCPGKKSGGMTMHNSYEKAYQAAMAESAKNYRTCIGYDNKSYTIYTDQCGGAGSINPAAINDLKNKIIPFLKRYKAEIENYKRYFSARPYKPGAIYDEYESMLKQAEENANALSSKLNNIIDDNLAEIESEFENIKNDQIRLQQADANYRKSAGSTSTLGNNTPASSNNTIRSNNSSPSGQVQQSPNIINQQHQNRLDNNERFFNTLQTGIQSIADILAENAQKRADEQRRRSQAEQQRRQQQLQAQQEEERRKQEAEARIYEEMMTQYSIDSSILSKNNRGLKTSAIKGNIDSVYYIGYKRQYSEHLTSLYLKVFVVYRYSDGTFPLFSTIVEKSKFENNIDRHGITLLVGFFQRPSDISNALNDIRENAKGYGIEVVADENIRKINFLNGQKTKDDNFWNQ
jgi:hypothetical protein